MPLKWTIEDCLEQASHGSSFPGFTGWARLRIRSWSALGRVPRSESPVRLLALGFRPYHFGIDLGNGCRRHARRTLRGQVHTRKPDCAVRPSLWACRPRHHRPGSIGVASCSFDEISVRGGNRGTHGSLSAAPLRISSCCDAGPLCGTFSDTGRCRRDVGFLFGCGLRPLCAVRYDVETDPGSRRCSVACALFPRKLDAAAY